MLRKSASYVDKDPHAYLSNIFILACDTSSFALDGIPSLLVHITMLTKKTAFCWFKLTMLARQNLIVVASKLTSSGWGEAPLNAICYIGWCIVV